MRRSFKHVAILLCIALASSGCASDYIPKKSPYVHVVQTGPQMGYMRDGKLYEGGLFGGDLDDAVAGNPEAVDYANAVRSKMTIGFVTYIFGAAALAVGAVVVLFGITPSVAGSADTPMLIGGSITAGVGLITALVGAAFMGKAQAHVWDAINVYNDGVIFGTGAQAPAPLPSALPSPVPSAAPPPVD